jgi:ribosomal protein uS17
VVVSRSGDKAVVVLGERRIPHPIYGKIIRQHKKYHACDDNTCKVGDTVEIMECRPVSKTIRWRVVKKAAEGGYYEAQYYLGKLYAEGEYVKKDLAYAKKMLSLAAKQGDPDAAQMLDDIKKKRIR